LRDRLLAPSSINQEEETSPPAQSASDSSNPEEAQSTTQGAPECEDCELVDDDNQCFLNEERDIGHGGIRIGNYLELREDMYVLLFLSYADEEKLGRVFPD